MDLEAARKTLAKRSAFSSKRIAFLAVGGLCLVAGILLRAGQYFGTPEPEATAPVLEVATPPPTDATPAVDASQSVPKTPAPAAQPAPAPTAPAEETGTAVDGPEQTEAGAEPAGQPKPPGSGMILVSRQPINVLASPSASAPVTYGFPAGRSFRLIGHEGGFAQIQDVKSGASGWIDEAGLAPPARVPPPIATRSQPKPAAAGRAPATRTVESNPKPKPVKGTQPKADSSEAVTEAEPDQTPRRPGLLGGLFGGIFGN
jgi:hypothetical protein